MTDVYENGVIYTGEGWDAQAISVKDGLIRKTGTREEVAEPGAVYHDLKGAFVVPGFNDSHLHVLNLGYTLSQADLTARTSSVEDVVECLVEFSRKAEQGWILGRGWNHDYFGDEKRFPDRRDLDRVSLHRPVVAVRACGHICSANSRALLLAGIDRDTAQPQGGCFDVEEDGEPNGIFREYGMDLIMKAVPPPDQDTLKQYLTLGMKHLNTFGITSAQSDDLAVFPEVPYERVLTAYRELEAEGKMTVKVYEQSLLPDLQKLKGFVERGYHTGVGSAYFRIGPLKIIGDGSLGARTARLSQPYGDDAHDPGNRGIAIYSSKELEEMVSYANKNGMQVAVHAIGDETMEMAVQAIGKALEECPREDHRHGIVHCQITTEKLLEEFKQWNLHPYIQSIFLDYDNHIVESRVGRKRAEKTYQFKTMMDMGLDVSNGSDSPVERPDVLAGIQCAVTRSTSDGTKVFLPEQALTVEEALATYTGMGAKASFEEHVKGKLLPGMAADFTILSRDIRQCQPDKIQDTAVIGTVVDGRLVYGDFQGSL